VPSVTAVPTVGVRLAPHVARAVLGAPPHQLSDGEVLIMARWDRVAFRRLEAAASPAEARDALTDLVRRRLDDPRSRAGTLLARAVALLGDGTPVDAVANELHISGRRLRERFQSEVGLAPKAFQRTARFHRFLLCVGAGPEALLGGAPASLAGLAADLGYADQAHLTRDFTALVGESPTRYAERY
jgi:AraC-like DNA-binding protein